MSRNRLRVWGFVLGALLVSAALLLLAGCGERLQEERASAAANSGKKVFIRWELSGYEMLGDEGVLHLRRCLTCDLEPDPDKEGGVRWPPGSECEAIWGVQGVAGLSKIDCYSFKIRKARLYGHDEIQAAVARALEER